jgi:hypothetical protein
MQIVRVCCPVPVRAIVEKQDEHTCALCEPIEARVSTLLSERFTFGCVRIDDPTERSGFERCLIATMAACPICKTSPAWLGAFAYNGKIRASGLWQSQHLHAPVASTAQLDRFEGLVRCTL